MAGSKATKGKATTPKGELETINFDLDPTNRDWIHILAHRDGAPEVGPYTKPATPGGPPSGKADEYLDPEYKYSPDQPRDDHGRWTSDGGGSGASGAKTSDGLGDTKPLSPQDFKADQVPGTRRDLETSLSRLEASADPNIRALAADLRGRASDLRAKGLPESAVQSAVLRGPATEALAKENAAALGALIDPANPDHGTEIATAFTNDWNASSNDAHSLALQQAASEKWGTTLDSASKTGIEALTHEDPNGFAQMVTDGRSFLDASYQRTQDYLRGAGISEIRVARGLFYPGRLQQSIPEPMSSLARGEGTAMSLKVHPLSSWSNNYATADVFSQGAGQVARGLEPSGDGYVLTARVPASAVASIGFLGAGTPSEGEYVVASNSVNATIEHTNATKLGFE